MGHWPDCRGWSCLAALEAEVEKPRPPGVGKVAWGVRRPRPLPPLLPSLPARWPVRGTGVLLTFTHLRDCPGRVDGRDPQGRLHLPC